MAFKTLPPPDEALPIFYNVHMPVGPNPPCTNQIADVMLVQLCLQQTFDARLKFGVPFPPPPRGQRIQVDGKVGPVTLEAIVLFQNHVKLQGKSIRPDGIVNRAGAFTATSQISHTIFTIVWLNESLQFVIGEGRFRTLEDDSITPFALKVALAASAGSV
jgi:peptidoglycan hydrolase-like protein with peptidoglycan-binding domain